MKLENVFMKHYAPNRFKAVSVAQRLIVLVLLLCLVISGVGSRDTCMIH